MNAAVLAGGLSSRMNFNDKSQLSYNGRTFIEHIISQLDFFNNVMIISPKGNDYFRRINAEIFPDIVKGIGPLGGIHSALINSDSEHVFVTTCDMPLIKKENIKQICSYVEFDIVIPVLNGKYEMLFALYSRKCLSQIEKLIDQKRYKITGIFEDKNLKVKEIDVDDQFKSSLKNINSEIDYKTLSAIEEDKYDHQTLGISK
ncbi:MAG: molybdenum cofactor guanylyltransferase [Spirochaetaceae bacterium]|nr:molybdenum cofactor guanylyltransferase [Spirochaetaceae bacterium]